jgi:hypothetical protein
MNLFIQVENGVSVNHPAFEQNLLEAFGSIPPNWEPFVRVENPTLVDKTLTLTQAEPSYEKIDGIWQHVWHTRQKTEEELAAERVVEREAKLRLLQESMAKHPYAHNFAAWVLNEETIKYEPPVPRPEPDGKLYRWHGPSNSWREAESPPEDGKQYRFDFDNWVNLEIV